ncbi:MAG: starch-binding protein [Muribaculaceae bacterium]|nr:starch-binding protein [Muribaculaceae bacterium]
MQKFYKWAAAGLLAFSALSPLGLAAQAQGPDFSTFDNRTDFRDETIYFAITTRFYDGDPTNNVLSWDGQADQIKNNDPVWRGDFQGLIDKLDYIKALGFTAIWITPIVQNASGFDYHGYHAMDFSKVDLRYESRKEWGSPKDVTFKSLIDAAHAKGLKIVLDIVLQHTGNFGEDRLCHLFDRDQNIKNQADITTSLIPDEEKLGGQAYWELPNDGAKTQYSERFKYMKNTGGNNLDNKNYYHHVSNAWNWDYPSRWWGQIAGDCVDLNTENPAVVDYLVECYGNFIKLGVDAFRIDTTGHISPLTFNSAFIPRFIELGEQYKKERLDGMPFYMFGECCARYGGVIYRDQHVLSSHYYTWKSDPALVEEWKSYTADWWAQQVVPEGAPILGNMLTCEKDPATVHDSKNVFMVNGAWHEPDYSQASGFNVIDFPMHYNFNNASQAVDIAKSGDKYYNDASWNVVYVDSHDYSPGPNDGIRFDGGTAQWAENTSLMFTFRGIPCLYYGSEVEFQKGITIDKGPLLALKESGRAYYGAYLEGDIKADGFGKIKEASGNVKETLNGDLAQHIRRLNLIRQSVPALRKGQYTWDGCSAKGGWAFKRAYKDSYALVAINGGATFSNVPAGTYTDLVTGKTYQGGGSITVDAPATQGQLRVLVKDWKGGQVGEHGKFIYDTTPVSHGGNPSFTDNGTTHYYTKEDAVGPSVASVKFNPNGGTFKTETQNVTVTLSDAAVAGWYQIEGKSRVNLSPSNRTSTFTVGEGMNFGDKVTVSWSATNDEGKEKTGSVTYKKVDPNAAITIYVNAPNGNIYVWGEDDSKNEVKPLGAWPGKAINSGEKVGDFYSFTIDGLESVNVIFNNDQQQTGDITGITSDVYYEYDGKSTANEVSGIHVVPSASVTFSPNGGKFSEETITVTATAHNAVSAWYKIGNGEQKTFTSTAQFEIGEGMKNGDQVIVSWAAENSEGKTKTGTVTYTKKINSGGDEPVNPLDTPYIVYFVNTKRWNSVFAYAWTKTSNLLGKWPGTQVSTTVEIDGKTYYAVGFESQPENIIFNDGGSSQTADLQFVNNGIYNAGGFINSTIGGGDDPIVSNDNIVIYYDNSITNWNEVYVHYWGASETSWPGVKAEKCPHGHFYIALPKGTTGVVFNNNDKGDQTNDIIPEHLFIYKGTGNKNYEKGQAHECETSGIIEVETSSNEEVKIFNLQGVQVTNPGPGMYIVVIVMKV